MEVWSRGNHLWSLAELWDSGCSAVKVRRTVRGAKVGIERISAISYDCFTSGVSRYLQLLSARCAPGCSLMTCSDAASSSPSFEPSAAAAVQRVSSVLRPHAFRRLLLRCVVTLQAGFAYVWAFPVLRWRPGTSGDISECSTMRFPAHKTQMTRPGWNEMDVDAKMRRCLTPALKHGCCMRWVFQLVFDLLIARLDC